MILYQDNMILQGVHSSNAINSSITLPLFSSTKTWDHHSAPARALSSNMGRNQDHYMQHHSMTFLFDIPRHRREFCCVPAQLLVLVLLVFRRHRMSSEFFSTFIQDTIYMYAMYT